MSKKIGSPDLVLLTGDLAYCGSKEDYDKVDKSLDELLDAAGGEAVLIPVPGNHDLRQPNEGDIVAQALGKYHDEDGKGCDRQWLWFPLGAEGEAGH